MISGCIDRLAVAVALIGAGGADAFVMGRGHPPAGRTPALAGLPSARMATSPVTTNTAGERRAATQERRRSASASKVTMLMLAGGAWAPQTIRATRRKLADDVTRFGALGYVTVPVAYGDPRGHGVQVDDELANITAAYTRARAANRLGVVCAYGESAGGHLALMLATKVPTLDCVIAAASPADLTKWASQGGRSTPPAAGCNLDPMRGDVQTNSRWWYGACYVPTIFGRSTSRWSPARRWRRSSTTQALLGYASNDPLVPETNGSTLEPRDRDDVDIVLLTGGTDERFVHSRVTSSAARAFEARQRTLIESRRARAGRASRRSGRGSAHTAR